ncbi:hypothetical protein OpiT1DRAFT_05964 [Opitutaceae bacterium TAV1]|nr:hypothetical protein OpiT1DRAFT_05964 [Opitutaceae bacterium TAV1]
MATLDMTRLQWTLSGWRPHAWKLGRSMETGWGLRCDIGPVAARMPDSVQANLLRAGLLDDWNFGVNSRKAEWVEHYHWEFATEFEWPAGVDPSAVRLVAECLDYSGWILVNGREVAVFSGAMVSHEISLGAVFRTGARNCLSIIFDCPPPVCGQIGWTSRTRYFKPRYSYGWDWCPRFVPIGVSGSLSLDFSGPPRFELVRVRSSLAEDLRQGCVEVCVAIDAGAMATDSRNGNAGENGGGIGEVCVRIVDEAGGRLLCAESFPARARETVIRMDRLNVEPWWPNGEGAQPLYALQVSVVGVDGGVLWERRRRIGFKRIEWRSCEGAVAGALPWVCVVNGRPVFLQGVNWTPVRLDYLGDCSGERARLLDSYQELGCNLLRVWGGGCLEPEDFYDGCDERGLLVWQDFPLSSSGIDNWPPEEAECIAGLADVARGLVRRIRHRVSLLQWCGGNELQGGPDGARTGVGRPVDCGHPCIHILDIIVSEEDGDHRFIPTSPTGPRFMADRAEFGRGLHHEVHGPWGSSGFLDMADWCDYWEKDDALFRSEVAGSSPASVEIILKYAAGMPVWPPDKSMWWMHSSAWWIRSDRLAPYLGGTDGAAGGERAARQNPEGILVRYVGDEQREHAESIAIAAGACKHRFPRCGGFLAWMGHDSFPLPINTSIIDFDGGRKQAFAALAGVFHAPGGGVRVRDHEDDCNRDDERDDEHDDHATLLSQV